MKRANHLYQQIMDQENLRLAFRKAAKGKHLNPEVILFRQNFDANITKLQRQLLTHQPDIGHYRFFTVRDPKLRDICAASFPERVLHHAVMNICEPILDSYAIYDSYACRKEKGTRKALARAKYYAGQFDWYLKLDIRKYFDSIDHDIIMTLLSRRIKDKETLRLFEQLLETYDSSPGKGIPIGNLISQHLANFYLGIFDRWIKNVNRVPGYVRYMDDFILFGLTKDYLKTLLKMISDFLARELKLELKDNIQLNRCRCGIPFLGCRVFPGKILLSPRSRSRFINKFKLYEALCLKGIWTERELVRHAEPLIEFTKAADSSGFRKMVIQRFGVFS